MHKPKDVMLFSFAARICLHRLQKVRKKRSRVSTYNAPLLLVGAKDVLLYQPRDFVLPEEILLGKEGRRTCDHAATAVKIANSCPKQDFANDFLDDEEGAFPVATFC